MVLCRKILSSPFIIPLPLTNMICQTKYVFARFSNLDKILLFGCTAYRIDYLVSQWLHIPFCILSVTFKTAILYSIYYNRFHLKNFLMMSSLLVTHLWASNFRIVSISKLWISKRHPQTAAFTALVHSLGSLAFAKELCRNPRHHILKSTFLFLRWNIFSKRNL